MGQDCLRRIGTILCTVFNGKRYEPPVYRRYSTRFITWLSFPSQLLWDMLRLRLCCLRSNYSQSFVVLGFFLLMLLSYFSIRLSVRTYQLTFHKSYLNLFVCLFNFFVSLTTIICIKLNYSNNSHFSNLI